jgi:hypothetical protein
MKLFPSFYRILIITSKFVFDSLKKYHLCDIFSFFIIEFYLVCVHILKKKKEYQFITTKKKRIKEYRFICWIQ